MQGLKAVNLSISSDCKANCVFCPDNRGTRIKEKNMSFSIVKKIVDEMSSEEYKKNNETIRMELSENGDCFCNPEILTIMRYIKEKLPEIKTEIFTNFFLLNKDLSKIILEGKLIDSVVFNFDGSTEENYYLVKEISREVVLDNLRDFIRTRKQLKSRVPLDAMIITTNTYINTIHKRYGFYPAKRRKWVEDDTDKIKEKLNELLDPETDNVMVSGIKGWAEREQITEPDYERLPCPFLRRVYEEAFIAPNGEWYICCMDSNNEIVLGDVTKNTLDEIFESKKRQEIIDKLRNKKLNEIGGPCNTVMCC